LTKDEPPNDLAVQRRRAAPSAASAGWMANDHGGSSCRTSAERSDEVRGRGDPAE
jgi:hypothetical protein